MNQEGYQGDEKHDGASHLHVGPFLNVLCAIGAGRDGALSKNKSNVTG